MERLTDSDIAGILEFPCSVERLANGNTLIADAGSESGRGSEIIEVSPEGRVVWRSSHGYRFAHTARRLKNGNTIIADTTNDRILEVDSLDRIVWSSDEWGNGTGTLSDGSRLSYPNNIALLDNGFLVTNRNANEFVAVTREGQLLYRGKGEFEHPHNCEPIGNGRFMVADSDRNKILEMDLSGQIHWSFEGGLLWPRDANRLASGNTLIGDSKNSRVLEVSSEGKTVWSFGVDYFANFYELERLRNGNTLISDQQHHRVIEVSPEGKIVWEFRNFRKDVPIFSKLENGYFKRKDEQGMPEHWTLMTRFSEGGGKLSYGTNAYGKEVPVLEYDRQGALCLQQAVRVCEGECYTVGWQFATEELQGSACLQVAFKDSEDGLLCDVVKAPKGEMHSGTVSWTQESIEVTVPERAAYADIRLFINGTGRLLISEVRFQKMI